MMLLFMKDSVARASIPPGFDHFRSFNQITQPGYVVVDECDATETATSTHSLPYHHETTQTSTRGSELKTKNLSNTKIESVL